MLRSFRARLIFTVIALVAVAAGGVASLAFVLVRDSLRRQLIDDAVARAEFNITVLAAADPLPAGAGKDEFEATGLADRFLLRGTGGVYVEFAEDDPFASSLGLLATGELLPEEVRRTVADGHFAYTFVTVDGGSSLIVGGRRPPGGPDFYFVDPASSIDDTTAALLRTLAVAVGAVVLVGAAGAGLVARRVLRPVAQAGEAARLMSHGDLSVRLPADERDELGRLADAFNEMAVALDGQIHELVAARDREARFVADVSHELRTPVTALVNEVAHLEETLNRLAGTDRRVGAMLVADVARLRALVEDLLEVSRLDAGPPGGERSVLDPQRFLEAVIADRYPAAELRVVEPLPRVETDRRSLERIVGNLLDNARIHAPEAPVRMTVRHDGASLHVTVADDGPGVPPEVLAHLFDRFYKADPARRGGSGLGLAIAHRHARHLGGDLTVRPGRDRGLTFELTIPAEPLHSRDLDETSVAHPEDVKTPRDRRTP